MRRLHGLKRSSPALLTLLVMMVGACPAEMGTRGNIGGANQLVRRPGNIPGGWAIKEGDIAVHPNGSTFFTARGGSLFSGTTDGSGTARVGGLSAPDRLAFVDDHQFVALRDGRIFLFGPSGEKLWDRPSSGARRLDVAPNGQRVVMANATQAKLLDASTGEEIATVETSGPVRDVDFLSDGRILLTSQGSAVDDQNSNTTQVTVVDGETGEETCRSKVDNCAGEVELSNDEQRAFLSPTVCNVDPVSVLDLSKGQCSVSETTPGFGPVAKSPDGNTMVAFLDRDQPAEGVPPEVSFSPVRFHLMFLNANSLKFKTMPIGHDLPRYAFTPDGKKLLVDLPLDPLARLMVVNVNTRTARKVMGPPLKLNALSFSPDSQRAFVVDSQLFNLDFSQALLRPNGLGAPLVGINVTPQGPTLMVSQRSDSSLVFLDALSGREKARE